MVIQYIRCFKNFWGSANIDLQIPLKMGKTWRFWVQHVPWSSKIYIYIFSNGHIRNVVSTLPNVVKIDVENDNVASTLSNVVQFNFKIHNVVSTLLNVVNFNVNVHNVVYMWIWRCATSRRHINLKATLNRRWNVCWIILPSLLMILLQSKAVVRWCSVEKVSQQFSQISQENTCSKDSILTKL